MTSGIAPTNVRGGGGAGFQTEGANGGSAGDTAGSLVPDPAAVTTLSGGFTAGGTQGGGGGGAVTLIACRGLLSVSGVIDVGGGGGQGGTVSPVVAGFGGGSGGYLVLQGVTVEVTGQIFANGGAGGGGPIIGMTTIDGSPGEDGTRSTTVKAQGGIAGNAQTSFDSGGDGGVFDKKPTVGANRRVLPNGEVEPGGGGGSIGFLQTYTSPGVLPKLDLAVTSPPFQPNLELSTK